MQGPAKLPRRPYGGWSKAPVSHWWKGRDSKCPAKDLKLQDIRSRRSRIRPQPHPHRIRAREVRLVGGHRTKPSTSRAIRRRSWRPIASGRRAFWALADASGADSFRQKSFDVTIPPERYAIFRMRRAAGNRCRQRLSPRRGPASSWRRRQ